VFARRSLFSSFRFSIPHLKMASSTVTQPPWHRPIPSTETPNTGLCLNNSLTRNKAIDIFHMTSFSILRLLGLIDFLGLIEFYDKGYLG
jgi:hypothetical protein